MSGGGAPKSWSPPSGNRTGEGFSIGKSESGGLGVGAEGKMTAAQRMMAKMGWEEGQGLGKQKQGITTPLVAKKTDMRAGVIVNASESNKKIKSVNFNCPPTRVVLLGNMFSDSSSSSPLLPNNPPPLSRLETRQWKKYGRMCTHTSMLLVTRHCLDLFVFVTDEDVLRLSLIGSPGEVDDYLEGEIAEECNKFGMVTHVLIFEITEPNFPHYEAVRIFVQFERARATNALIELVGRFFGDRVVHSCFYDEEKFGNNAPMPGEFPRLLLNFWYKSRHKSKFPYIGLLYDAGGKIDYFPE
ncbi:DNA-damage-repair/toleration protein [Abeliophyllum distichum]|uniref:DNA-damage-repair/toleration protein n=1 Tax=Abeliophyllum distichum TaxID=126358 RepID=A0ABD1UIN6_9LAMI